MKEIFNKYSDYNLEVIPNDLGYFAKKTWVNKKIQMFSESNILVFNNEKYLSWVLIEDEDKYWLPYEKHLFFKDKLNIKDSDYMIIEQDNNDIMYYTIIDNFLFSYNNSFEDSVNVFNKYCIDNYKIIGVGEVDSKCDIYYSFNQLEVSGVDKNNMFINEESSGYDSSSSVDNVFYSWFEKQELCKNKNNIYIILNVFFIVCLMVFNFFFMVFNSYKEEMLNDLINNI